MVTDPHGSDAEAEPLDPEHPDGGRLVVAAVLFEGSLAPLAAGLGWLLGRSPLDGFAWRARDAALGVLAVVPMYALLKLLLRSPARPLARIRRFFDDVVAPLLGGRPPSELAMIALAAGVGEEMLFRGVLQGVFARWLGTWPGLAAASLLFGLLHPVTWTYVALAGLLGAYLGLIWVASGNLLTVIVAHAVYDFVALRVLLDRREAEPPSWAGNGRAGPHAGPGP